MLRQKRQPLVLNQMASNKRLNNSHNQDLVNQPQVKPIMHNLLNQMPLVKQWKDSGHGLFLLWFDQR